MLVSREITMNATPATVRTYIRDLHEWESWSPWQEINPAMQQTYFGAEAGTGAGMQWSGDKKAGAGRMVVVTDEELLVEVDIEFLKPFKAKNRSHFRITPIPGPETTTRVTWEMTGKQSLLMRVLFTLMRLKKGISQDFDRGLESLKSVVESSN